MTSITTRAGKGSPLTHNEVDANFTNLNNDKLDTAGIALGSAASPTLKFTGDPNTGIYSPGADQLAVSTGGTGRLFVDATGNVGVGANATSETKTEIFNTSDSSTTLLRVGSNNVANTSLCRLAVNSLATGGVSLVTQGLGSLSAGEYLALGTNNTERLRIDSSGNVGIGTASPSAVLHVVGTSILFRGGAGTVSRSLELGSVASAGGTSTSDILLATYGGNNGSRIRGTGSYDFNAGTAITFGTSPTSGGGIVDRVTINSAGNVGIGTTSPTTLLDVNTDTVRVRTARTPASASATGATGEICWDANYIYVCTATNTWKRSALSTW